MFGDKLSVVRNDKSPKVELSPVPYDTTGAKMKSANTPELSVWEAWPKPALVRAPTLAGVYVFRLSGGQSFARVRGESDIVYIGCARNIRRRLKQHDNTSRDDRSALHRISHEVGSLEIAWKTCNTHIDAQVIESTLLSRYAKEHIEFPPANRQQSLKKLQDLAYWYGKCPPEQQQQFKRILYQQ